jgi:uncharacterized protein with HEPN domain
LTGKREDRQYLEDILDAIGRLEEFVRGVKVQAFRANDEKIWAVAKGLEIIGEATKGLSASVRHRRPDVPWREIAGMRDVLVHHYFKMDVERLWLAVEVHLPVLREAASQLLGALDEEQEERRG